MEKIQIGKRLGIGEDTDRQRLNIRKEKGKRR